MKLNKSENGFNVLEAALITILLVSIGLVGWRVYGYQKQTQTSIDASVQNADELNSQNYQQPSVGSISPSAKTGYVQGKLEFPGSPTPEMSVCAEPVNSPASIICYDKPNSGANYSIRLPAGRYYVYAQLLQSSGGFDKGDKAYFNEFVICGLKPGCPESGHSQNKVVTVDESKTTTGVDPTDWYTN